MSAIDDIRQGLEGKWGKEPRVNSGPGTTQYGEYLTPETLLGDPLSAYAMLQQAGVLPQGYSPSPTPVQQMLSPQQFQQDDRGRAGYTLPTQQGAVQDVAPDVIAQYLANSMGGEIAPMSTNYNNRNPYASFAQSAFAESKQRKEQVDAFGEIYEEAMAEINVANVAGPENAKNLRNIADVSLRLLAVEDNKEAAEVGQAILHIFRDYEPFRVIFDNETDGVTKFEDTYKPPKEPSAFLKLVSWAFDALAKPFESVAMTTNDIVNGRWKSAATRIGRDGLHAVGEIGDMFGYITVAPLAVLKAGAGLDVPNWLSDPVSNLLTNPLEAALDRTGAINSKDTYDVNKDGQIDFFEAWGINPDWGKDWGIGGLNVNNAVNLLGTIAMDPITWATFGLGGIAKGAIGGAARVVTNLNKSQLDNIFLSLGDDAALAATKGHRAGEIVANLQNNVGWKTFAKEGDEEILETLLKVNRSWDEVGTKLNQVMDLEDVFNNTLSSQRVQRAISRRTQRVMDRTGGGMFITRPGMARGGGIGLKDHRVPFTRSLYQKSLSIRGTSKASWAYTTKYVPKLLNRSYKGQVALKTVSDDIGIAQRAVDEILGPDNPFKLKFAVDKETGVVTREGEFSEWMFQQKSDLFPLNAQGQNVWNNPTGVRKMLDILEDAELIQSTGPGKWKFVDDLEEKRKFVSDTAGAVDDAMKAGVTDIDGLVRHFKEAGEWGDLAVLDEVTALSKLPEGARPQDLLSRINYQTKRRSGLYALEKAAQNFRTFSKAEGKAGASTITELRHFKAGAVRAAEFSLESIQEVLMSQGKFIKELLSDIKLPGGMSGDEALARIIDSIRSAKDRPSMLRLLKDQYKNIPESSWDEIGGFVDNLDQLAYKYHEINKTIKGKYTDIDPSEFIPRSQDPGLADNLTKWLNDIDGIDHDTIVRDLSDQTAVRGFLESSETFMKLVDEGVTTIETAAPAIAKMFNSYRSIKAGADAAEEAFAVMDEATIFQKQLETSHHLRARTVLPEVRSVIKVNEVLAQVLEAAGKQRVGAEKFNSQITKFYDIDPVDQWLRYAQDMSSTYLLYDFFGELENLTLFDELVAGAGTQRYGRPAAIMGKLTEYTTPSGRTAFTYEFDVPSSYAIGKVRKKSFDVHSIDEAEDMLRKSGLIEGYDVQRIGDNLHLIDEDISKAINEDILPAINSGYTSNALANYVNNFQTVWSAYATVPVIGGTGYHSRNWGANMFMMALAGMRNPKYIGQAIELQHANSAVHKFMRENFILNYKDALEAMTKDGGILYTKGLKKGADFRGAKGTFKKQRLMQMNKTGVLNQGFFADMGRDQFFFTQRGGLKGAKQILVDNPIVKTGQRIGSTIEDNSRIALYLDGLDSKGLNVFESASRVRDFLFDYGDLTKTELMIKSKLSRFYTFMRKNADLQFRLLASQPGSVLAMQRMVQSFTAGLFGGSDPMQDMPFVPDWIKDSGWAMVNRNLAAVRFETPYIAALETIQNVSALPQLLPFTSRLMPDPLKQTDFTENWRNTTQLLAGGIQSAITFAYDEAAGKSTFSGATLNPNWQSGLLRFVGAGMPAVIKATSMLEKFGMFNALGIDSIDTVASHQELSQEYENMTRLEKYWLRAMNVFGGVQTYMLDTDQQMRLVAGFRTEYNKILKDMQEEGIEIPTMDELRLAGNYAEADQFFSLELYTADPVTAEQRASTSEARRLATEHYGIDMYESAKYAKTDAERLEEVETALKIFTSMINRGRGEEFGLPLITPSAEDILNISLQHPSLGIGNEELGILGIEQFYDNVFTPEEIAEKNMQEGIARTVSLFDMLGIDLSYVQQVRPVMSEAERLFRQGHEMGLPTEAVIGYMWEEMSKREQFTIFGPQGMEHWATGKGIMTQKEAEEMNKKLSDAAFNYMAVAFSMGLRPKPHDVLFMLIYGTQELTQAQRERLGLLPAPVMPKAEDPRTPQLKDFQTLVTAEGMAQQGFSQYLHPSFG